jgi:hypothetical protein
MKITSLFPVFVALTFFFAPNSHGQDGSFGLGSGPGELQVEELQVDEPKYVEPPVLPEGLLIEDFGFPDCALSPWLCEPKGDTPIAIDDSSVLNVDFTTTEVLGRSLDPLPYERGASPMAVVPEPQAPLTFGMLMLVGFMRRSRPKTRK